MKNLLFILSLAVLSSCHPREFSIIRNFNPEGKKKLVLDNTYQFFVREIYKESTKSTPRIENYSLTNKNEKTDSSFKERIEIEYILFSPQSNKLLYITTVPDRYQKYYSSHTMPKTQLNTRDFNTFHIGKIKAKDKADFKTYKKNTTYTWQYNLAPDSFSIKRIIETKNGVYQNERSVENSIYQGAKFRRVNHFELVYKDNKGDTTLLKMLDPALYVSNRRKKYFLYLNFSKPLPIRNFKKLLQSNKDPDHKNSTEFTTIIFKGSNRIPYDPGIAIE